MRGRDQESENIRQGGRKVSRVHIIKPGIGQSSSFCLKGSGQLSEASKLGGMPTES